jgi:hypothetical protein
MQPAVQLKCTLTVAVQTETAEIAGHAVRQVTFRSESKIELVNLHSQNSITTAAVLYEINRR